MKVIEILKLGRNFLLLLQKSCIKMGDVTYIGLYDEYREIIGRGGKSTYAVAVLSEKYGISERQVYYIVKKFATECAIDVQSE